MSTEVVVKTEESSLDMSFKLTLPPRKRAKTEEEKEQRRVERILRNRRAAHASREKKRKHVEHLEAYVLELELQNNQLQANYDAVFALLTPQQRAELDLPTVKVSLELKDQISGNLVGTLKVEVKLEFTPLPVETPMKRPLEEDGDEEDVVSSVHDTTYYNYLSPVSINSPINSPIDLTLTQNTGSLSPLASYGLMEQSSAVTLSKISYLLCLS